MPSLDAIALIQALGTSGVAASIAAVLTGRMSGSKKQEEAQEEQVKVTLQRPSTSEHQRLAEEVVWLRQQVITWQERAALAAQNSGTRIPLQQQTFEESQAQRQAPAPETDPN